MSNETWLEVLKPLAVAGPIWIIVAILAIKSPQLVREFFAGVERLLKLRRTRTRKDQQKIT
jgi:hypothetical protein